MSKTNFNDFRKFATDTKINGKYLSGLAIDDYKKKLTVPGTIYDQNASIIEERPQNIAILDIFTKLIQNRILYINDFDQDSIDIICGQLLYLNTTDSEKEISMYIDSYGGQVYSLLSLTSTMQYIPNTINTVGMGIAASCASVALSLGDYGYRYIQPYGTVLIHQPMGGCEGPAADMTINCEEINRVKHIIFTILAERTGHTYEQIEEIAVRDKWLSAQDAFDFHIVDHILEPQKKIITYNEYLATKDSDE